MARVFNRIQQALKETDFPLPSDWNLTVSMGAADLLQNENSIDPVIKRADDALYRAKNSGRDQIVI